MHFERFLPYLLADVNHGHISIIQPAMIGDGAQGVSYVELGEARGTEKIGIDFRFLFAYYAPTRCAG